MEHQFKKIRITCETDRLLQLYLDEKSLPSLWVDRWHHFLEQGVDPQRLRKKTVNQLSVILAYLSLEQEGLADEQTLGKLVDLVVQKSRTGKFGRKFGPPSQSKKMVEFFTLDVIRRLLASVKRRLKGAQASLPRSPTSPPGALSSSSSSVQPPGPDPEDLRQADRNSSVRSNSTPAPPGLPLLPASRSLNEGDFRASPSTPSSPGATSECMDAVSGEPEAEDEPADPGLMDPHYSFLRYVDEFSEKINLPRRVRLRAEYYWHLYPSTASNHPRTLAAAFLLRSSQMEPGARYGCFPKKAAFSKITQISSCSLSKVIKRLQAAEGEALPKISK